MWHAIFSKSVTCPPLCPTTSTSLRSWDERAVSCLFLTPQWVSNHQFLFGLSLRKRGRECAYVCMCGLCAHAHTQVSAINSATPQGIILPLPSLNTQDHPHCLHIFKLSNQPSSSNKMTCYFSPLCVLSLLPESQVLDSLSLKQSFSRFNFVPIAFQVSH